MSVIVIEFITLDGIVSDPDGSDRTPAGGWAFRNGPETVAGDKFQLGSVLDQGVMLFGRKTWELFAKIWPGRDTPFAARLNAVPKLVASRTLTDTSAFPPSEVIGGDLIAAVQTMLRGRLSPAAYVRALRKPVVFAAFAADDPLPGLVETPLALWRALTHRLPIIVRDFWRRRHSPHPSLSNTGLAVIGAMFAAGLFEYNFGDSEFLMLFLVLVTLPYAAEWEPAEAAS